MDRVKGKVAIVTGGAQRVGRTICLILAREGAKVAVLDVEDAAGEAVAAEIREHGGEARYWHMDVRREAEVSRVVSEVASHFGRVDVLVNNANIGGTDNATDAVTEAQWDEVMAVNVKGLMFCTKHVVPPMRHQGGGSIVNVSSIYGMVGSPHAAAFHASKGAVRIMTSTDALAYADDRIRVNVVMAGFIWNPADDEVAEAGGVNAEMARNAMAKMHPLGILGEPEDVAYGVLYLASDEAKFVTGTALVVDGGYTSR